MKNKILSCLLALTLSLAATGCGTSDAFQAGMQDALDDTPGKNAPVTEISSEIESEEPDTTLEEPDTASLLETETQSEESQTSQATESESSEAPAPSTEAESTQLEATTAIENGDYEIDGINFSFSDSVKNDVTGNWRISLISDSATPDEYALDYYNTLFSSDDEIHAIVNFSLNTTTKISVVYTGVLDVTILEYVDGEEHDAKELFGGNLLAEYWIHTDTGEIEKF